MVIVTSCHLADMDFQGRHANEEFHLYYHQHWIRLLWPLTKLIAWNILIFGLGALTFIPFSIEDAITRRAILVLLTVFFFVAHAEFLARFYRHFLTVIVVTDRKVHRIKKTLFLIDDHQSVDLSMLQDVMKSQHSIVQKLFGFGTIILEAQETMLRLHFTPHIHETYDRLMQLREFASIKMSSGGAGEKPEKPAPLIDRGGTLRKSERYAYSSS
ncbi:MAG TPA: hypothetical protein VJB60_02955 [Candidatus Peribacterales bacterium]|nr:hypothetical protein [Candidatus Peribacterales bacterium]